MSARVEPRDIERLVRRIEPLFAGQGPVMVGAALADLTATWLASHLAEDQALTADLRERLLSAHIEAIRKLIPVNEGLALDRLKRRAH